MKTFTFPASLPALTTIAYMFTYNHFIENVDASGSSMPLVNTAYQMFYLSNSIYQIKMPASMPEVTTFSSFVRGSSVVKLTMPTSAPKVTTYAFFAMDCSFLSGTVTIPESQVCTTLSSVFKNCVRINKALVEGEFTLCTIVTDIFQNCAAAEEVMFPDLPHTSIDINYANWTLCNELKKITFPQVYGGSLLAFLASTNKPKVEEFYGFTTCPNLTGSVDFNYPFTRIRVLNLPAIRLIRIMIGASSNPCLVETIDIDWTANYYTVGTSPQIFIAAKLDSTELNRIMTALPTVSGGTFQCAISNNPGYAGCTPSIATAKGWTVS
jgi:hypothetical protein